MPNKVLTVLLLAVAIAALVVAPALAQKPAAPPAPAVLAPPYKPVTITPPGDLTDAAFTALRVQLADAVKKRDAAALAKLVVGTGFFWERDKGDAASKRRTGYENLSAALGLSNKDSAGWDMLAGYAEDPTASAAPSRKGVFCAPADPAHDVAAFDRLLKTTQTQVLDWGYPVAANTSVHAAPTASAPVIEKLGLHVVRVMPDNKPGSAAYQRIVTPSGKAGYVSIDAIAPFGNDQICYVKDAGGWKIGGYIGGGEPQ